MKQIFFLFAFAALNQVAFAQNGFNCSSHDRYQEQLDNDPVFRMNQEQLEQETKRMIANKEASRSAAAASYIIPVVFHVIYTTNAGNISDAQIVDQIAILNQEFNRLQADTILTPQPFKTVASPFSVEFRLATLDPNGQCTNGINRIYSTLSNCSFEEDDVKSLSYWPSNRYLNIWIVQSMHYSGSMDCSGGGYATFPGGSPTLDGINIRGDLISNIGTAAANSQWGNFKGRYLIHELGHWFNLRHIWGDQNCGNDLVNDTPIASTSNSNCPSFPHNAFSSCPGSNANGEMFMNYMDYTNGPCLNMFTAGQVARMDACINSGVSGRSNLWTNSNLNATGTNNPYTYPVSCLANPAVLPYGCLVVCAGDSIKFTDNSYGGNSTSRTWDFTGGSATSLTDSIVKVSYSTAGTYSVGLTKNFQSNSKTEIYANKVKVLDNIANLNYVHPFSDSFETPGLFESDWIVVNNDNDITKWELMTNTGYNGSNCVGIMNYQTAAPLSDDLISPAYDLSGVLTPTMTFRLHFANRITANYDKLVVYISNNCGKTWQQIYSRSATGNLKTVPASIGVSNIPAYASDDDWRLEKIVIMNAWAGATSRFKFAFTSGGGNNIFVDDINIEGISTVGLNKNNLLNRVKVYPNPAKDNLNIDLSSGEFWGAQLQILDVLGKVCFAKTLDRSEDKNTTINVSGLERGIYFINLKKPDESLYTTKFIKQNEE